MTDVLYILFINEPCFNFYIMLDAVLKKSYHRISTNIYMYSLEPKDSNCDLVLD